MHVLEARFLLSGKWRKIRDTNLLWNWDVTTAPSAVSIKRWQLAIERPRAGRRPDEQITVVVVTDFDLNLPNVEQVKASSITEEAADKFERLKLVVTRAFAQLKDQGVKITQTAVSAITGYSQEYLSRHWKILQMLLEDLYSKSNNFS